METADQALQQAARANAELARQKTFIERIINHVPAAITLLDRELVFQWANPEWERLYQVPLDVVVGKSFFEVFPAAREQMTGIFKSVLETACPFTAKGFPFFYTLEGKELMTYWDITYYPTVDETGQTDGVLILSIEVSDRVENERLQREQIETLRQAHLLKDELLSLVSHELRTPVHALMGFARLLEKGRAGPLSERQLGYLHKMIRVADHLGRIVSDILDMSHIHAGTFSVHLGRVSLEQVVREVVSSLSPLAEQKKLHVVTEVEPDLREAKADPQRVRQVLTNLVSNAIKFTPEGGRISVNVRQDGGTLRVEVEDTGLGIAPDDIPRLFQPFTQLDMSSTRESTGTGLGLSISKGIVRAHGGEIAVMSVPGRGSTFWFTLPHADHL